MKTDILNLVATLSNQQADVTLVGAIYDSVVDDLGDSLILSTATLVTLGENQEEFTLPATLRRLSYIIWDDTQIGRLSLRQLESLDYDWRSQVGTPVAWTDEAEPAKTIALYPNPFTASVSGSGLGATYPLYSVVLLHSQYVADAPAYLDLYLAYEVLAREYERESNHTDPTMSKLCRALAGLFLEMVQ